jgi:hypothetical protein
MSYKVPKIRLGVKHSSVPNDEFKHGAAELTEEGRIRSQYLYYFTTPEDALRYVIESDYERFVFITYGSMK